LRKKDAVLGRLICFQRKNKARQQRIKTELKLSSSTLGEGKNLHVGSIGIGDVNGGSAVAVRLGFAISRRIAENRDMRGMLFWNDESQANVAKFQKRPSRVLIDDAAFEMRGVPVDGCSHVLNADGDVIEGVQIFSIFRFGHGVISLCFSKAQLLY